MGPQLMNKKLNVLHATLRRFLTLGAMVRNCEEKKNLKNSFQRCFDESSRGHL